jgi:hypothetical protein
MRWLIESRSTAMAGQAYADWLPIRDFTVDRVSAILASQVKEKGRI